MVGEVPIIFQDRRRGASKISRNEIVKGAGDGAAVGPETSGEKVGLI